MSAPRPARSRVRVAIAVALGALVLGHSVGWGQSRDTVWTRVSGSGSSIVLAWHKDHPWDAGLSARGAELIAEYRTEARGLVREPLGRASSQGDRALRFRLPDVVRSQPLGEICLYVQPLGRQGLLPVRRTTKEGHDTARFRYEAWEREARSRAEARAALARLEAAERELEAADQRIATHEATLVERGWTSDSACEAISAASGELRQPYNVVPVPQHDEIARRVCVRRVWAARVVVNSYVAERLQDRLAELEPSRDRETARDLLRGVYSYAFVLPEAARGVTDQLTRDTDSDVPTGAAAREALAREFLRDWTKHSPTMAGYEPHLGRPNDTLRWPSSAGDAAFRLFAPALAKSLGAEWALSGLPGPTDRDHLGLIGAALDAYAGCVDDARKQLRIAYDNWEALRASEPERAHLRREFLVRECQQAIETRDRLREQRERLEAAIASDRQVVAAAAAASAGLPAGQQILNAVVCGQQ